MRSLVCGTQDLLWITAGYSLKEPSRRLLTVSPGDANPTSHWSWLLWLPAAPSHRRPVSVGMRDLVLQGHSRGIRRKKIYPLPITSWRECVRMTHVLWALFDEGAEGEWERNEKVSRDARFGFTGSQHSESSFRVAETEAVESSPGWTHICHLRDSGGLLWIF